ncbi:MAG: hypothetical protein HY673_13020 [Chloroflexi bacterium]|nr:hypothetical protein [Chloroflexota bacterium]
MVNPLYACNIGHCQGCWVTEAGLLRTGARFTAGQWLGAINLIPQIGKVDICGGEPLLWEDLHYFCYKLPWPWAVTTNLVSERYREFTRWPLRNCLSFTCSFHPEGGLSREEFASRAGEMARHYPVTVAILEKTAHAPALFTWFTSQGFRAVVEPYEPIPRHGPAPRYSCEGGRSFAYLAPDGDVFACVDSQRAKANCLGNLFKNTVVWPQDRLRCALECNTANILAPYHPAGDVHNLQVTLIR